VELAEREVARTRTTRASAAGVHYRDRSGSMAQFEERYQTCEVTSAFRALFEAGQVQLDHVLARRHGYLPAHEPGRALVAAQIGTRRRSSSGNRSRPPEGMWLRNAATPPGVESVLQEFRHPLLRGRHHGSSTRAAPAPRHVRAVSHRGGPVALGRDAESIETSLERHGGLPGDASYREYYRDQGFDLPMEQVREVLPSGGTRTHLGLNTIGSPIGEARTGRPYEPARASARAKEHARHSSRERATRPRRGRAYRQPAAAPRSLRRRS